MQFHLVGVNLAVVGQSEVVEDNPCASALGTDADGDAGDWLSNDDVQYAGVVQFLVVTRVVAEVIQGTVHTVGCPLTVAVGIAIPFAAVFVQLLNGSIVVDVRDVGNLLRTVGHDGIQFSRNVLVIGTIESLAGELVDTCGQEVDVLADVECCVENLAVLTPRVIADFAHCTRAVGALAIPCQSGRGRTLDGPAFHAVVEVEAGVNQHIVGNVQRIVLRGCFPSVAELGFLNGSLQFAGGSVQFSHCGLGIVVDSRGGVGVDSGFLGLQQSVVEAELGIVEFHGLSIGSNGFLVDAIHGDELPLDVGCIGARVEHNGCTFARS